MLSCCIYVWLFDVNQFNEVLHKGKAIERQIWVISNTITTMPILKTTVYSTDLKGIWSWQLNIVFDEEPGFVLTPLHRESGVVGGCWLGHCSVTQTQCSKSSKVTKHQNSSCSIVMQYTRLRQECQEFSRSVWQWRGYARGRLEVFTPLSRVAFQEMWHRFLWPFCLASRGNRGATLPRLEFTIGRYFNSSFHQLSRIKHSTYCRCYSTFQ